MKGDSTVCYMWDFVVVANILHTNLVASWFSLILPRVLKISSQQNNYSTRSHNSDIQYFLDGQFLSYSPQQDLYKYVIKLSLRKMDTDIFVVTYQYIGLTAPL